LPPKEAKNNVWIAVNREVLARRDAMLPATMIAFALMAYVGEGDMRGDTALHRAVHNLGSNFERKIYRAFDQNLAIQNNSGSTPLMSAVIWNNKKAVALLLRRDAKQVNTVDKYGRAPLHYAVGLGLIDIARMLLRNGASPDIKDKDLQIPRDIALRRHDKNHALVRLLSNEESVE
jgi:ankyrin repeat protein